MLKSLLNSMVEMMPKFDLSKANTSVARQAMFDCGNTGRAIKEARPKHRIVDCGYAVAFSQGFRGTSQQWEEVKRNYIEDLGKNVPITYVIDCNNILFDGQGIQDADGKWHR